MAKIADRHPREIVLAIPVEATTGTSLSVGTGKVRDRTRSDALMRSIITGNRQRVSTSGRTPWVLRDDGEADYADPGIG